MITAWVLYRELSSGTTRFEELSGTSYTSTNPEDWGLSNLCIILLTLQKASFIQGWVEGTPVRIH